MSEPAALTDRAMHRHGYTKPMSKQGAWCSPLAADHANATSMALGSKALLAALWRSHPIILARHAAAGRQVVQP